MLQSDGKSWKTITIGITQAGISIDSAKLYGNFSGIWTNSQDRLILVGSLCYEGYPGYWKLSDIPNNTPINNFYGLSFMRAVLGSASDNIFVCGDRDLMIHWNGGSWYIYNQFFDKSKQSSLTGIWVKNNSVFVVGYENSGNEAIVYKGTQ